MFDDDTLKQLQEQMDKHMQETFLGRNYTNMADEPQALTMDALGEAQELMRQPQIERAAHLIEEIKRLAKQYGFDEVLFFRNDPPLSMSTEFVFNPKLWVSWVVVFKQGNERRVLVPMTNDEMINDAIGDVIWKTNGKLLDAQNEAESE